MKTLLLFISFLPDVAFWSWKTLSRPIQDHTHLKKLIDHKITSLCLPPVRLHNLTALFWTLANAGNDTKDSSLRHQSESPDLTVERIKTLFLKSDNGKYYSQLCAKELPKNQLDIELLASPHIREFNMNVRGFKKALTLDFYTFVEQNGGFQLLCQADNQEKPQQPTL